MKVCLRCQANFEHDGWRCPACGFAPPEKDGFPAFAPALAAGNEGYDDSYFAQLYELEARNDWFRARNSLLTWAMREYFQAARMFLEIGCGTGYVLDGIARAMPQLTVHASEVSSSGLPFAARLSPVPGAAAAPAAVPARPAVRRAGPVAGVAPACWRTP